VTTIKVKGGGDWNGRYLGNCHRTDLRSRRGLAFVRRETTMTKAEKVRDAQVSGIVNLVAGIIQMAGGTIAFPIAQGGNDPDIFVITKGVQH
jgi:hypothetical protein